MENRKKLWPLARLSLLMIVALLFISACSSTETSDSQNDASNGADEEEVSVTYESDVEPFIAENCLTCHGEASPIPLHDYDSLMVYVNGDQAGAFMRSLDNGDNRDDGQPGSMYDYLGESEDEREENLAMLKDWVGNWTLDTQLSDEDRNAIKAPKN